MRVAIDHRPARTGIGGIAVYVRELVRALALAAPPEATYRLFEATLRRPRSPLGPEPPLPSAAVAGPRGRAVALRARLGAPVDRLVGGADVVHLTDYAPLRARVPVVATVHDVLFEELPDCFPADVRRRLRRVTATLVDRAARIVVPSARAGAALSAHFDVAPERVDVVAHGTRVLPRVAPEVRGGPYVLCVGTLEPRKNHRRLIEAFATLRAARPDLELVLAGSRGWMDAPLLEQVMNTDGVVWIGPVDRTRLARLYAGAAAVAYPSRGEGFGLSILEALSLGQPLLVGRDTTCADVAGSAALAVDVHSSDAIADGLRALLDDEALRARLAAAGPAHAATFTWARAAAETRAVYARALR